MPERRVKDGLSVKFKGVRSRTLDQELHTIYRMVVPAILAVAVALVALFALFSPNRNY
jgi:hypothetical protein